MSTLGFEVIAAGLAGLVVSLLTLDLGARRLAAIAVSLAVLAYWQPGSLALTLVLTALTAAGVVLARQVGRSAALCVVGILVGVLVARQYGVGVLAPISLGLSFTVFRLIGVLLDSVSLRQAVTLPEIALLAVFFPTYRSGPITTVQSLQPLPAEPAADRIGRAALRILCGLTRKLLLADTLASLVLDPWTAAPTPERALLLPFLFGLRVYWDFAGYTDIAIGLGALWGFRVPENFDRPYLSRNLVEFWRRWHITLSEWIRLRLFMKMAGRRAGKLRMHASTLVAMALCGAWHGAGWGFLLWGVWHGVGIVAVHLFDDVARKNERRPTPEFLATAATFTYVSLGWLLFFLPLGDAASVASLIGSALTTARGWGVVAALLAAGGLVFALSHRSRLEATWQQVPAFARGLGYAVLVWALMLSARPTPFVYFRF